MSNAGVLPVMTYLYSVVHTTYSMVPIDYFHLQIAPAEKEKKASVPRCKINIQLQQHIWNKKKKKVLRIRWTEEEETVLCSEYWRSFLEGKYSLMNHDKRGPVLSREDPSVSAIYLIDFYWYLSIVVYLILFIFCVLIQFCEALCMDARLCERFHINKVEQDFWTFQMKYNKWFEVAPSFTWAQNKQMIQSSHVRLHLCRAAAEKN